MRILFVCNEYPLSRVCGGIGVFTRSIAQGLIARGHRITVIGYGQKAGSFDDNGVKVVLLPQTGLRGIAWLVNRRRVHAWIQRQVREGLLDVIEVPEYGGLLPFRLHGCPIVIRLHMSATILARRSGRRPARTTYWLERQTLLKHRSWIGVSHFILNQTIEEFDIQPGRSAIIANPFCAEEPASLPPSLPKDFVLYAGTVCDLKGAFVLAAAARLFLTAFPDVHLVYAGRIVANGDSAADETIRHIVGPGLQDRVHCLGHIRHDEVLACMQ
ncbi:MAG: glycosyltransferase family 4 protein, partial [Bryobacterales bacterium]|nr:glycosyltransferase family 4 protein [Bryobacterales bacterium]